jgi:hypothetical protein
VVEVALWNLFAIQGKENDWYWMVEVARWALFAVQGKEND